MIISLFKKGCKDDPGNYRPITLRDCIGKLYASILNARLTDFLENNNLLHTSQNGFRTVDNRNCDDHVFCLSEICRYAKTNKSPLHICFIDFKSAFDMVPRNALLYRLRHLGIDIGLY